MRYLMPILMLLVAGCGGGETKASPVDAAGDARLLDGQERGDVAADVSALTDAVENRAPVADVRPDADVAPEPLTSPALRAYVDAPAPPVLPDGVESCALINEERCQEGESQRCELFDVGAGDWAPAVPPMTEQAFYFDRYYDLYHEVEGQTMDFRFTQAVPSGTPEEEWSKPEYFRKYDGYGDASGWTGTAVWAAAARYRSTGTEADYMRMLEKLEKAMFMYEVNGIPGMIVRSHWAMLEEGAPEPNGLWGKSVVQYRICDGSDGHFCFPIPEQYHDRLPDYYKEGIEFGGVHRPTQPYFQADASRDMYVRGLPGLLLAYDLLKEGEREDAVRAVVKAELPCTVNRLKKGRIYNLDAIPDIKAVLTTYFAGGNMLLDDGEEEAFNQINELTFFVMEQPNPNYMELFDSACPDGPPMEVDPGYDYDASDPYFLVSLAGLAMAEGVGENVKVPIAWSQHVSVRGADAVYVTQWALVAHYVTGDSRYLDFVNQLIGEINYELSVNTYGALQLPKWCTPHYGPSLIYPSLYNMLARIDKVEHKAYWKFLSTVARVEGREKDIGGREDCLFGILYNRMVDETTDPTGPEYVQKHVGLLATYGMDPDNKLEPDRNYPRNWIDNPDPEVPLESIPEDDLAMCTTPIDVAGVEIPSPGLEDDWPRAVNAIPLPKRVGGAFLWQMDPWMAKREYGGTGMNEQWPMLGMTAAYWSGRSDGVIEEGAGLVLAWQKIGVCQ